MLPKMLYSSIDSMLTAQQNEFLPSTLHLTPSSVQKSHLLTSTAQDTILQAIQSSQLALSPHPTSTLPLSSHGPNPHIQKQRQQILEKKSAMLREISELEMINHSLLKDSHLKRSKEKLTMSRMQPEDKQLLQQLTRKRKQHEQELENRVQHYQEGVQYFRQQQVEQEKKKMEADREERRAASQQRTAIIKERLAKRQDLAQEQRKAVDKLKSKKKLFQRMENNFMRNQEAEQTSRKQQLEGIHQAKSTSFVDIRTHQKTHDSLLERQATLRKDRLLQSTQHPTKKHKVLHLYGGISEQRRHMVESAERWNTMLAKIQNNIVFSEKVRQSAKKHIKSTEESRFVLKEGCRRDDLEREEVKEQGIEFMRAANRHNAAIRQARLKNSRTTGCLPEPTEQKQNSKPVPVDYLRQMRLKRKAISPQQRFWQCLRTGDVGKAVTMAGGLEARGEESPFRAAMRKLKMLQSIE